MGDRGECGKGRVRKPPEKPRNRTVPEYLDDALQMTCMTESKNEGGFSDAFFYDAQKSQYESGDFFVTFEKNFRPPAGMLEYHNDLLLGRLKPCKDQNLVSIGPSRKSRLYSSQNVKSDKDGRNVAFMESEKVLEVLFPSFVEQLVACDMLKIPSSLVGNTDQTPLALCANLEKLHFFEGIGNAGKKKLQASRMTVTLLPVDQGGRMAGCQVILPSGASTKKKDEEGYIYGDKLSAVRVNELEKFGIRTMKTHIVEVDGEERTVFSVLPSSNGWHQGHNMSETCEFVVKTKFLACKAIGIPKETVALLTCDNQYFFRDEAEEGMKKLNLETFKNEMQIRAQIYVVIMGPITPFAQMLDIKFNNILKKKVKSTQILAKTLPMLSKYFTSKSGKCKAGHVNGLALATHALFANEFPVTKLSESRQRGYSIGG